MGWRWSLRKTQPLSHHVAWYRELILKALESGAQNIIIGIGGSATNDGGAGMVQALGRNSVTPTVLTLALAAVA